MGNSAPAAAAAKPDTPAATQLSPAEEEQKEAARQAAIQEAAQFVVSQDEALKRLSLALAAEDSDEEDEDVPISANPPPAATAAAAAAVAPAATPGTSPAAAPVAAIVASPASPAVSSPATAAPAVSHLTVVDPDADSDDPREDDPRDPQGSPDPPAAPPVRSVGRTGLGEDHLDLWYGLVEWVSASHVLDAGVVLAWDSEEVGARVLALADDPVLLNTLAIKQAERKRLRIQAAKAAAAKAGKKHDQQQTEDGEDASLLQANASAASASPTTHASTILSPLPANVAIPYELAQQLLAVDRNLAQLRLISVPSRVSEETFWSVYFAAVLRTIRLHVLSLQQPEQKQDTNQHLEAIIKKQIQVDCHSNRHN